MKPGMNQIMRISANRFGHSIGLQYVGGYPKSGTTWISKMIAHYLDLPVVMASSLALGFKCVIHHHWNYHSSLDRSIYVIRDGRDVMVSVYSNLMKGYQHRNKTLGELGRSPIKGFVENAGHWGRQSRRLRWLYGKNFDPWDVERNLPIFIEAEFAKPFIAAVQVPWTRHIQIWKESSKHTTFVKYEDILDNGTSTLAAILNLYLEDEADKQEVEYTVNRYSFQKITGRSPGIEDRTSIFRKGIKGDWRNYFTSQTAQVFDHYAGDLLIELGYESNRKWIEKI